MTCVTGQAACWREADAVAVQAFLRHAKLATTERLHAKPRPDDLARLDRAFQVRALDAALTR
jgi:hypothetical protein